jgi:flagellar motor switch protein FliN
MAISATVLQLFAQDFDGPRAENVPEPEVIEPTFNAEEVAAAREQGWAEGRESALAEAVAQHELALATAAMAVAEQVAGLQREWQSAAEENARATARLVFDVLGALFPALNAAHGEQESLALVQALLPGLARQPAVMKLGRGAVVELDRKLGEAIDIYVNNRLVARGEVVMVDDTRLGVTMTEIVKGDRSG